MADSNSKGIELAKAYVQIVPSVSYTHLTLPTN